MIMVCLRATWITGPVHILVADPRMADRDTSTGMEPMKERRFAGGLYSLTLATVITVTGCAGGSSGSIASSAAGIEASANEDRARNSAAAPLSTMEHSPVISVTAGDDSCVTTAQDVAAGRYAIIVHNSGDRAASVFLYGAGGTVVADIADVGTASEREVEGVVLSAGVYNFACSSDATGPEVQTPLTVTG